MFKKVSSLPIWVHISIIIMMVLMSPAFNEFNLGLLKDISPAIVTTFPYSLFLCQVLGVSFIMVLYFIEYALIAYLIISIYQKRLENGNC